MTLIKNVAHHELQIIEMMWKWFKKIVNELFLYNTQYMGIDKSLAG